MGSLAGPNRPGVQIMRSSALPGLCGLPDNAEYVNFHASVTLLLVVCPEMEMPVCSALSGVFPQMDLRNRSSSSSGWKRKLPPDGGWSFSSDFSFSSKLVVT